MRLGDARVNRTERLMEELEDLLAWSAASQPAVMHVAKGVMKADEQMQDVSLVLEQMPAVKTV